MTPEQAVTILGANSARFQIGQIVHALSLHPWNNTVEEAKRLEAAKWARNNWKAFTRAAQERRERRKAS